MAEVRTHAARALAEELGDAIRDPLFVADAIGDLVFINVAGLEAFGYEAADIAGLSATALVPELSVDGGARDGAGSDRVVVDARRKDGSTFPAEITLGEASVDDGEITVWVVRDVSDQLRIEGELRRTRDQLVEAERLARLGSWEWDIPANKVSWSDELFRIYGREPGEIEPSYESFLEHVHPDDRASVDARNHKAFADHQPFEDVKRALRADGTLFQMRTKGEVVADAQGNPVRMLGVCEDVTAEKQAERALGELASLIRSSHDAIIARSLDGTITSWNPGATQMYGYTSDEAIGQPVAMLIPPAMVEEYEDVIERVRRGEPVEHFETRRQRKDGSLVDVSLALSPIHGADGELIGISAIARDITERKRFETQLQRLADHDPLTGLINRRRFEEELIQRIAEARRYGGFGAVLMLDLDNFKYVNDAFGHSAGDDVLRSVGKLLRDRLRETDVLARLGGDEFAVLLPHAREPDAARTATSLLETLRDRPLELGGRPIVVTASIGIACFAGDHPSAEQLLADADRTMYRAKDGGRDRFASVSADEHRTRVEADLGWEHRIREALERDLFVLYCQPILDLRTGQISRHELLLRMADGDGDVIAPGAFLGVAERLGLIHAIDRWVVARALELLAQRPDLSLEVNLSAQSLDDRQLLDVIREGLVKGGVDPARLIFEITETAAIGNTEVARRFAGALHELGASFALDDFGAGFGSFHYLKHLPVEYLKIDGDFVSSPRSRTDELVIESIVHIARGLDKQTIAECVEDSATLEALRVAGVDLAQGFHVGKPRPASTLLDGLPPKSDGAEPERGR